MQLAPRPTNSLSPVSPAFFDRLFLYIYTTGYILRFKNGRRQLYAQFGTNEPRRRNTRKAFVGNSNATQLSEQFTSSSRGRAMRSLRLIHEPPSHPVPDRIPARYDTLFPFRPGEIAKISPTEEKAGTEILERTENAFSEPARSSGRDKPRTEHVQTSHHRADTNLLDESKNTLLRLKSYGGLFFQRIRPRKDTDCVC